MPVKIGIVPHIGHAHQNFGQRTTLLPSQRLLQDFAVLRLGTAAITRRPLFERKYDCFFHISYNQIFTLRPGDLVVTADFPLAANVLKKGGVTLNLRR